MKLQSLNWFVIDRLTIFAEGRTVQAQWLPNTPFPSQPEPFETLEVAQRSRAVLTPTTRTNGSVYVERVRHEEDRFVWREPRLSEGRLTFEEVDCSLALLGQIAVEEGWLSREDAARLATVPARAEPVFEFLQRAEHAQRGRKTRT